METTVSKDGTRIAFDRMGSGPTVILVSGAMGQRSHFVPLAELLSAQCTVITYDRRGRGDSSDTAPYAVEREIDDLAALIDVAGGSASLYGVSSGAILSLEATGGLNSRVERLILYEPPFIIDSSRPPLPSNYVEHLDELVAAGRRGDAVEYFMTDAIRLPDDYLVGMREWPGWAGMEAVAHTLAYDGRVVRDFMAGRPLPAGRWDQVTVPTTVITGELSEPFFIAAAQTLAELLPDATHGTLPGQDHNVSPDAIAPVMADILRA